ncbi:neurogenic locus notch homolog protein 1-like isoform X2 [Periplaneta americana]
MISSAPALDEGALWILGEGNSSDEASVVILIGSEKSYSPFSCAEKSDGVYRDPMSCTLHYRCSHGHREVYKCLDGYLFNAETLRCEEEVNVTCTTDTSSICKILGDGLYANYTTNCQDYFRCEGHILTSSYTCGAGFSFSTLARGCVATGDTTCIEPHCATTGNGFYILPGSSCRAYYHCDQGIRTDYICPPDTIYDRNKEACVPAGGLCYEPLCTGRVNGQYPDTSHQCERSFECSGGALQAVYSCPAGQLFNGHACLPADTVPCQAPESTAVAIQVPTSNPCKDLPDGSHTAALQDDCRSYILCKSGQNLATLRCPVGLRHDGRQCADAATTPCLSDCVHRSDGYYTDLLTGCRSYFYCLEGRMTERRTCAEGTLYNGHMCIPSQLFKCPLSSPTLPAIRSNKCALRSDGFHTVYASSCQDYYYCSEGKVILEGSCSLGQVWNGKTCVEHGKFLCKGPEPWPGCVGMEAGLYQDYNSRCHSYYYCENGNRTQLVCPQGQLFDGKMCVPADTYECPYIEPDVCSEKPDGYYSDIDSSCRSYFYCSKGYKFTYVCTGSYVFDGKECVDPSTYKCPYTSKACISLSNGYHYDTASGCRKYFYCSEGDKITTLTCAGNKVFNGQRCVEPADFQCPHQITENFCALQSDGLFPYAGSRCRRYIHCKDQKQISISTCPDGKVFDGSACVEAGITNACRSAAFEPSPSPDCTNMLNGFYQNYTSGCRSYFYCIDGMKTVLTCPGNELFNGQLCVSSNSYTCPPVPSTNIYPCSTNHTKEKTVQSGKYMILHIFPPT